MNCRNCQKFLFPKLFCPNIELLVYLESTDSSCFSVITLNKFPEWTSRKSSAESLRHVLKSTNTEQPLVISPVHEEDPNFSFHQNNGFTKPPTSSSQARLYPQTTRSKVNDYSSDAMQFIDFVKRMGRNDSSRTALQHGQLSNSNFRGFRSSRRSETEGNEGGSTSTLPVRIDDQTSQEGRLGPNEEKTSTRAKN